MPRCLHLLDTYLPRTETFIWQVLRKSHQFPPLVLADAWENLDQFPLARGDFLKLKPERAWWTKVRARLTGTYAAVNYPNALAELRGRDIAVCHAHKGYRALVTLSLIRNLGKPLIVNFYGSDVSSVPFLRRAESGYRGVFQSARFLLAEGPAMRNRLLKLGAPSQKIRLQRIAIDPSDYPFRERSWNGQRELHLLFVGRLVEKKGLAVGLQALAACRFEFPWKLTVIGDGPLRGPLESQAARLGIREYVDFAGFRSLAEMRARLQESDLLLQPSRTAADGDAEGGAPTVILEAQASGLPIISTLHDDIPYITVPGQSAWLAPEGDVEALAALLREACKEAERWSDMGKKGRAKVEADHDVNREIERLEELYQEASGLPA